MQQTITEITTVIPGDRVGDITVVWDMNYWYEPASSEHPDNLAPVQQQMRSVEAIKSIHIELLGKSIVPLNVFLGNVSRGLRRAIAEELLKAVEDISINDLKEKEELCF